MHNYSKLSGKQDSTITNTNLKPPLIIANFCILMNKDNNKKYNKGDTNQNKDKVSSWTE
jgi:hypothetical protein